MPFVKYAAGKSVNDVLTKEHKRKLLYMHSIYTFVISTNKAFSKSKTSVDDKVNFEYRLANWLKQTFSDKNLMDNILLDFGDFQNPLSSVRQIKTYAVKEYGAIQHRLHVQFRIKIRHKTQLGFDKAAVIESFKKEFGYVCHMSNVKAIIDHDGQIQEYMNLREEINDLPDE